jgi:cysteine-rich repeat protein
MDGRFGALRIVFCGLMVALCNLLVANLAHAQIAGCPGQIAAGSVAVAELRHDNGSNNVIGRVAVGAASPRIAWHANRFTPTSPMLITHVCVNTTDPGSGSMEVFIALSDNAAFLDLRPGSSVWSGFVPINVGWQLVPVSPPVAAGGVTWIGAKFSPVTSPQAHMGVSPAITPLTKGQSLVGLTNRPGAADIWTDYQDVSAGFFQGNRALIRGLNIGLQNCSGATLKVSLLGPPETSENGATATFSVNLEGPTPSHNVVVSIGSSNVNEGIPNPSGLIFTPASAGNPQLVVVTGQDDPLFDGPVPYTIGLVAASQDFCYHGLSANVPLVNADNESAGPLCGDGIRQPPEQCDDGNAIDGDGCSRFCLLESAPVSASSGSGLLLLIVALAGLSRLAFPRLRRATQQTS